MMGIKEKQQELIDDFAFLSDWEQKYEYIIDLGKELKGLPEEKKKEDILINPLGIIIQDYHITADLSK